MVAILTLMVFAAIILGGYILARIICKDCERVDVKGCGFAEPLEADNDNDVRGKN